MKDLPQARKDFNIKFGNSLNDFWETSEEF